MKQSNSATEKPQVALLTTRNHFTVCIFDEALSGASIHAGDRILGEVTDIAEQGKLVIVKTPVGNLLRFFFIEAEDRLRLEAANGDYPTLYFRPEEIRIIGRLIKLERHFSCSQESEAK